MKKSSRKAAFLWVIAGFASRNLPLGDGSIFS
jgi:hypothetical protein